MDRKGIGNATVGMSNAKSTRSTIGWRTLPPVRNTIGWCTGWGKCSTNASNAKVPHRSNTVPVLAHPSRIIRLAKSRRNGAFVPEDEVILAISERSELLSD